MSLSLAIQDLQNVLEQSLYLDRVDNVKIQPGSREFQAVIGVGTLTTEEQFGKRKQKQALDITVTIKTRITPDLVAELMSEIDKEIIADRRRNGQAQTTILDEDGWSPGDPGKESFIVMTRFIEVDVYENIV